MSPATGVGKTGLWLRQGGPFKRETEKSRGCQQARGQHWVPGPLPRRCQAHQVGLRGEGRGAWGCGDVMVPRRGRKEEGRRGDKGRAQATGLTGGCQPGRGRGEFSLHPPFHLHTPELVFALSYWLLRVRSKEENAYVLGLSVGSWQPTWEKVPRWVIWVPRDEGRGLQRQCPFSCHLEDIHRWP